MTQDIPVKVAAQFLELLDNDTSVQVNELEGLHSYQPLFGRIVDSVV
jgi:hypothetical protein